MLNAVCSYFDELFKFFLFNFSSWFNLRETLRFLLLSVIRVDVCLSELLHTLTTQLRKPPWKLWEDNHHVVSNEYLQQCISLYSFVYVGLFVLQSSCDSSVCRFRWANAACHQSMVMGVAARHHQTRDREGVAASPSSHLSWVVLIPHVTVRVS